MTPALEGVLRGLLTVVAFAALNFAAQASNLSVAFGPMWASIIATAATCVLAGFEQHISPAGTVAFGSIGKKR